MPIREIGWRVARNVAGRHRVLLAVLSLLACETAAEPPAFEVLGSVPHDPTAYTQGLVAADSLLYESTGRYGMSDVRIVDGRTGQVLARRPIATSQFGEGLALHAGRLYQLTWKEGIAYTYDPATLAPIDSFRYPGEGWGLASDGTRLYLSDGSDSIRVLVPETFAVERVIRVHYRDAPLRQLNELEFVGGMLLANVYETNWIAQIDLQTGAVARMLDFSTLYPRRAPGAEVMNGIAATPDGAELLLTGKLWPTLFRVRVLPP